ncbi:MAG: protein kinase [Deltaproteobacteria bacterium]|nr:protein kinase [Deltaproteobacteria bacterium]
MFPPKKRDTADKALPKGTLLGGRFRVVRPIGTGGMGSVYLAHDEVLEGDPVAVKVLHPELVTDERQMQRFMREVQLMKRVDHPNVVRTFDVGAEGDIVYFTMEYVPGKPLEDYVEDSSFPLANVPKVILQICEGLDAIHRAGVIHRDLKPANVMVLDDGTAKITDFGVARPEYSNLTAHNEIVGSALYISPEVWLGTKMTPSIDLYSLGVMLYELTTGILPFEGDTPAALMRMHLEHKPPEPKSLNKKIPPWLNKLIMKLLEKSALDRPKDARDVIEIVQLNTGGSAAPELEAKPVGQSTEFIDRLEELSAQAFGPKILQPEHPHDRSVSPPRRAAHTDIVIRPAVLSGSLREGARSVGLGFGIGVLVVAVSVLCSLIFGGLRPSAFASSPEALSVLLLAGGKMPSTGTTLGYLFLGSFGPILRAAAPLALIGAFAGSLSLFMRFAARSVVLVSVVGIAWFSSELLVAHQNGVLTNVSVYSAALATRQRLLQLGMLDPISTIYQHVVWSEAALAMPWQTAFTFRSFPIVISALIFAAFAMLFVRRALRDRVVRSGAWAVGIVLFSLVASHVCALLTRSEDTAQAFYERSLDLGVVSLVNSPLSIGVFWGLVYLAVAFSGLLNRARPSAR